MNPITFAIVAVLAASLSNILDAAFVPIPLIRAKGRKVVTTPIQAVLPEGEIISSLIQDNTNLISVVEFIGLSQIIPAAAVLASLASNAAARGKKDKILEEVVRIEKELKTTKDDLKGAEKLITGTSAAAVLSTGFSVGAVLLSNGGIVGGVVGLSNDSIMANPTSFGNYATMIAENEPVNIMVKRGAKQEVTDQTEKQGEPVQEAEMTKEAVASVSGMEAEFVVDAKKNKEEGVESATLSQAETLLGEGSAGSDASFAALKEAKEMDAVASVLGIEAEVPDATRNKEEVVEVDKLSQEEILLSDGSTVGWSDVSLAAIPPPPVIDPPLPPPFPSKPLAVIADNEDANVIVASGMEEEASNEAFLSVKQSPM